MPVINGFYDATATPSANAWTPKEHRLLSSEGFAADIDQREERSFGRSLCDKVAQDAPMIKLLRRQQLPRLATPHLTPKLVLVHLDRTNGELSQMSLARFFIREGAQDRVPVNGSH